MKKQVLLAVAALALSGAASAQVYGVVSAGVSKLDTDCAGANPCDRSGNAFKILGGYKFNPNVAAEFGYFNFGKARFGVPGAIGTFTSTAFGGGVAFHQDFASNWNFVGRLGVAQVKAKLDVDAPGVGNIGSASDNNTQLYLGLGVGYKVTKSTSIDLSWDTTKAKFEGGSDNVHAFNLGVTFGF
jgi:OmpA-OmpF porin, OOP family